MFVARRRPDKIAGQLGDRWRMECDVTDDEAVRKFFDAAGAERVVPNYRVMSVAKAALESAVR